MVDDSAHPGFLLSETKFQNGLISLLICWLLAYFLISLSSRLFYRRTVPDNGTNFLVGLSILCIGVQGWAFFLPLKWFLPFSALLALIAALRPSSRLGLREQARRPPHFIFITLLLVVLLFSAALPSFINDDSSYYQQTIKWLNEYGLVPGLANLNIRLGLSSGWHMVCSVFYLDQELSRFYNLNGLLLLVLCTALWKEGQRGVIASIPLLLSGALFVNAPSPDLLVLCGTFWLLYKFHDLSLTEKAWIIALLIGTKPSAGALLLFLIPGLGNNGKKEILTAGGILLLGVGITLAKNVVLTGYPLFPLTAWPDFDFAWKIPSEQLVFFKQNVLNEIFDSHVRGSVERHLTLNDQYRLFFELRTYKKAMILASLISFAGIAFYFFKQRKNRGNLLWVVVLLSGSFWLLTAPNYRYALGFMAFFMAIIGIKGIDFLSVLRLATWPLMALSLAVVLAINILAEQFLFVVRCGQTEKITPSLFLRPIEYPTIAFEKQQQEDMFYYDPADCLYCSDTPIPCYPDSIKRMHSLGGYKLRMKRGNELRSGFLLSKEDPQSKQRTIP